MNNDITHAHGCKKPDECYIDEENKNIFIIEKKNQNGPGSVCEKIQTSDFKKWQYVDYFHNIILFIFTVYQTGLKLVWS